MNRLSSASVLAIVTITTWVSAGIAQEEGLLGHWTFDRLAADRVADSSGNGRHGVVHGAVLSEGAMGEAVVMDGRDDYVTLGDFGCVKSATIAFWMRADEVGHSPGWQGLVTSDTWEEGVLHIPFRRGLVEVYLHMGDNRRGRLRSSRLDSHTWYHVAVVADAADGTLQLFVNGVEEDMADIGPLAGGIRLAEQVVGREFDGRGFSRYFRGSIDDVRIYNRALSPAEIGRLCPDAPPPPARDARNLRTGHRIPDEGYCDQPYVVITRDGHWLCTMTTGPGREGDHGQHIVAVISRDQGRTWSEPVDIEPASGPEASWVIPLVVPSGRVYGFYTYNGDLLRQWEGKPIRTDTVGWYCYKYSDDGGRTWSGKRYRLPLPLAPVDRNNTFGGAHQIFWGIGKPITHGGSMWFAFSRCGALVVDKSEGWFFRSDNILTESDPEKITWQLLPDGDGGLKNPDFGDVHAEQNLVALSDGTLYCMYRTQTGYPFHAYSRDGGHTWTQPVPATYTPGGRKMKTPRACPRIWRTAGGKFLFWYHNHSDVTGGGWTKRNPAWISGGLERDGHIHWSQPEILLYDPDPAVRTSYPDLIEQDGRYWVTETQKTIARVHEIDKTLLEGLWSQGQDRQVVRNGLVLELTGEAIRQDEVPLPEPLDIDKNGGLTVDVWLQLKDLAPGQVLLDTRTAGGRGLAMVTTASGTLRLELDDGRTRAAWDCDPGVVTAGRWHHVVAIVDNGPGIIRFVVDGVFCDGGDRRPYGWGRYSGCLGDVSGSGSCRLAPAAKADIRSLRIYRRYLRTSEAIANFHAGR